MCYVVKDQESDINCTLLNWNLLKHHLYDELAPFSSDKIRAKILDLGYGGARRALHNLSPKSARIYQRQSLAQSCSPQGLGHLVTASTREQVRIGQVRSGQVRSSQVRPAKSSPCGLPYSVIYLSCYIRIRYTQFLRQLYQNPLYQYPVLCYISFCYI